MSHNMPVKTFRIGAISAAVWERQGKNSQVFYTVTIERRYKEDNGTWKSTNSYSFHELLAVAKVCQLATDYLASRTEDENALEAEAA